MTDQSLATCASIDAGAKTRRLRNLAAQTGLEYVDLESVDVDSVLVRSFPEQYLFRHCVLPLRRDGQRVRVAIGDPFQLEGLEEITVATGFTLEPVLACDERIKQHLNTVLGVAGGTVSDMLMKLEDGYEDELVDDLDCNNANSSSVGRIVEELLSEAVRQRASDIHIECADREIVIRFRVDGLLRRQPTPPALHRFRSAIVSRLKIMCRLNIAEKRRPQDGRTHLNIDGRTIDIRASFIPMLEGEEVALRLLDNSRITTELDRIELPPALSTVWRRLIRKPNGLLLVTGPTGSGKTTTLYSSLADIRNGDNKIVTVEDPVEYNLDGISQIQVHEQVDLTFSTGLRSILRHDPDVILVGEMRDRETTASAVQAALTGHLVLSTLHTNDAPSAITRIINMGVEPFIVASTLRAVLAQRLVRRLCESCKKPATLDPDLVLPPDCVVPEGTTIFEPEGCVECGGTGYHGRIGVFELLVLDRTLRTRAAESLVQIEGLQGKQLSTLIDSGWERVLSGLTSVDELIRVCCP